ncbi:MAG: uroporphyrinogen decarboxylase family protein [SAR202 cluster bacterium]|nr:uroporphyrinogen decarboxylase family protein [SAR202 cluster bacterium]
MTEAPKKLLTLKGKGPMENSRECVLDVLEGRLPDRPPLYDCIRNDAVINHFSGKTLTVENATEVVPRAFPYMADATRPPVRVPYREREEVTEDGRKTVYRRWTSWCEHYKYASSEAYARARRSRPLEPGICTGYALPAEQMATWNSRKPGEPWGWTSEEQEAVNTWVAVQQEQEAKLGDLFFFWGSPASPDLMLLFEEVGIEHFSYYLADCPEVISDTLELQTARSVAIIEHVPEISCPTAVFLADDIAFKTGTICSPVWMRSEYFPRLKRVIDAWHRRGTKVLFHSDGNLMLILDDLVEAGIDGLNPIEVMAGMNVGEIHRRHPHLFMCGGIDVSQLLPFATPQDVHDATIKAIEEGEGRLMVGSTTEVHEAVPLQNYLAMRETVLDYRY